MSATVNLVVSEFVIVAFLCHWIMNYYKSSMVTVDVHVLVYLSWVLGLAGVLFLPYDISLAICDDYTSQTLGVVWRVVYWSTFLLAWILLPIQMEYHSSGYFSFAEKLKDSLKKNLLTYAVGIVGGIIFVIYLIVKGKNSFSDVVGLMMALSNTYGVVLIIVLMGNGLVALPKRLWQMADLSRELQRLYISASGVEATFQEARYELEDCEADVEEVLDARLVAPSIDDSIKCFIDNLASLKTNFVFESRSSTRKHSAFKNKGANSSELLTKEHLVELRAKTIKAQVKIRACERRWHTLLIHSQQFEEILNGGAINSERMVYWNHMPTETTLSSNASNSSTFWGKSLQTMTSSFKSAQKYLHFFWLTYFHKWFFRALAIICAFASILILWSEMVMASKLHSPIGVMMGAYESDNTVQSPVVIQGFAFLYLSYMSICTYWSLFQLNLGWQYSLQGPQLSPHTSLLFNGCYFSRLQFSMGYNFLLTMNVPRTSVTAFNGLMSNIELIPVFGTSFTIYVPIIMILVAILTLLNGYSRVIRLIGIEVDDLISGDGIWTKSLSDIEREQLSSGKILVTNEYKLLVRSKESVDSSKIGISDRNGAPKPSSSNTVLREPLVNSMQSHMIDKNRYREEQSSREFDFESYAFDDVEKSDKMSVPLQDSRSINSTMGGIDKGSEEDRSGNSWSVLTSFFGEKKWSPLSDTEKSPSRKSASETEMKPSKYPTSSTRNLELDSEINPLQSRYASTNSKTNFAVSSFPSIGKSNDVSSTSNGTSNNTVHSNNININNNKSQSFGLGYNPAEHTRTSQNISKTSSNSSRFNGNNSQLPPSKYNGFSFDDDDNNNGGNSYYGRYASHG